MHQLTSQNVFPSNLKALLSLLGSLCLLLLLVACGGSGDSDDDEDDDDDSSDSNTLPIANAGPDQSLTLAAGATTAEVTLDGSASSDPDGSITSYVWSGNPDPDDVAQPGLTLAVGTYVFTLVVTDNDSASSATDLVVVSINPDGTVPPTPGSVSINSTSRNGAAMSPVVEKQFVTDPSYQVLAVNDLGMHCGDLDTRISSILPPFNVVHAQVVQRGISGSDPRILGEGEVQLEYSAASNPSDPALVKSPELADNGDVFKTNFWKVANQAYAPFYPPGILDAFYTPGVDHTDIGLPVPDVERLYLEDGELHASQLAMPGLSNPYLVNDAQLFNEHIGTLPFFINFPFGYTADLNLFEAAGIPVTVYDDSGRNNPYPLIRVQARNATGQVIGSLDTVVPVSGEADCQRCHAATADGGNGSAVQDLIDASITLTTSIDDPATDVPGKASVEWAADINLLQLHDLKHNTSLYQGIDPVTGTASNPVVCQTCHYTPALDLAQVGPKGGSDPDANGREQLTQPSMSNVMHSYHAGVTGTDGAALFPEMPPAIDANGNKRDFLLAQQILEETCYSCHPGSDTQCLRGAMASAGLVCQDCHGNMQQVGNDFSSDVSPTNPGGFELAADYYTNPNTPRVPWANEPGCGSCHTGDANSNLASLSDTLTNPVDILGNVDGIRLVQAYRVGDAKATAIVPVNKRFAENTVASGDAAGNPKLYRVSTGHGGLFCEACHGSTHAEWPNANPNANDNVAAIQIQGHTGTISECTVCHEGDLGNTLEGPHGLHPVGANTRFAEGGHEDLAENNPASCAACHGPGSRTQNVGTVLSAARVDRVLRGTLVRKGEPVGCSICHDGSLDD